MTNKKSELHHNVSNKSATLPAEGMWRWNQLIPHLPFSREKFRQLSKAGRAPQPIKFSERCTAYSLAEINRFIADPLNYRAEVCK